MSKEKNISPANFLGGLPLVCAAVLASGLLASCSSGDVPIQYTNLQNLPVNLGVKMEKKPVYNGGMSKTEGQISPPDQLVLDIPGNALKQGEKYSFDGMLIVKGDIPDNVALNIRGPLEVNGNVGSNSKISATLPLAYNNVCNLRWIGKVLVNQCSMEEGGLLFANSKDSSGGDQVGVVITGKVSEGAQIYSNAGARIGGFGPNTRVDVRNNGKKLEVTIPELDREMDKVNSRLPVLSRKFG